ncbi:riboflavin biosynthesis protein RibT [Convivina intestini]|uniref:riboflavin biosynthesis protein RibT n=1 Tax=Convivina intestini TaxID=1505726 RepID=UPI00200F1DE0|nr:riboflavin biosynthesis protein RibT [Convivina intestini]CAH1852318.1 Protein RibT [Convivina intestini]
MLIKSRQDDEKMVMGLFSLLPGLKEIAHLNGELAEYQKSSRTLYVWQENPQSQIQGLLGVEQINPELLLVRHIILTPGVRSQEHYFQMLDNLQHLNQDSFIMGSLATQKLVQHWRQASSQAPA